jgi:hypothetical protein
MSIIEEDSESVIRLGTIHSWLFKISMWAAPIFFIWAVTAIMRHDTEIAVLKMQIAMMQGGGKGSVSQNVNVGKADAKTGLVETSRDYVTTADIAKQEQVTERAVIDWISAGRIEPMPVKSGKSWVIAKNFRIVPNDSECCGETPNPEPDNRP